MGTIVIGFFLLKKKALIIPKYFNREIIRMCGIARHQPNLTTPHRL
jgi:hypothetical protein